MAEVLLTHSYHLPYDSKQLKKMQPYLPLGTLYAASALQGHGISVAVFDSMLANPEQSFTAKLQNEDPRIVAVYEDDFNFLSKMCLTRMRDVAWHIAHAAKQAGVVTIVHGSDSTDNPELFLDSGFDYVLCGEAESTLVNLCSAILKNAEIPELDGLIYRNQAGSSIRSCQRLARNAAWVDLSSPARDLVDLEPYRTAWRKAHGYVSTNMVASRGCPFRCNWCAKPISGDRFQSRSASVVALEMGALKESGVEHVWFGDDVFALNHHWVKEFSDEVTKQHAAIPFKIQSRADLMHEDTVQHLKVAGCSEVWMGVESGSQKILDAMDKGITVDDVVIARQRLKKVGIRACFFLQFGYPGETWTELQQTIDLVRKLRPDEIGISFSYPLPGTVFYERVQSQLGAKRNWTDSNDLCIMFKAAYTTDFYRAVRDALHAEVDSWRQSLPHRETAARIETLWQRVEELEPLNRVADAFSFRQNSNALSSPAFISVDRLMQLNNT